MSDVSQGTGWWMASDGKWYPPEQHPDHQVPAPPEPAPFQADPAPAAAPVAAEPLPEPGPTAVTTDEPPAFDRDALLHSSPTMGVDDSPFDSTLAPPPTAGSPVVDPAPTQAIPIIDPAPTSMVAPVEPTPPPVAPAAAASDPAWPDEVMIPPKRRGGGFGIAVALLGWLVVIAGGVIVGLTIDEVNSRGDAEVKDYLLESTSALTLVAIGLVVVGVGVTAAAVNRLRP